ncbi:hypothetical protein E2542_SST30295 [Spatholobus suberectus]|nr:hypothetical protein E2542_SST30295 [Spatholobus suberectus]
MTCFANPCREFLLCVEVGREGDRMQVLCAVCEKCDPKMNQNEGLKMCLCHCDDGEYGYMRDAGYGIKESEREENGVAVCSANGSWFFFFGFLLLRDVHGGS